MRCSDLLACEEDVESFHPAQTLVALAVGSEYCVNDAVVSYH